MPKSNDAMDALIDKLGLRLDDDPAPTRRSGRRNLTLCDSQWKLISASLRESPEGVLSIYLKLPADKLWEIVLEIIYYTQALPAQSKVQEHLTALTNFFKREYKASSEPSIFLRIPVEEIKKDILSLKPVADYSKGTSVEDFIAAVEAGLRNDPKVDWITRCGGPAYVVSKDADPAPQVGDKEILELPVKGKGKS